MSVLLFFFLMLPPPPRSTLFPYTTLFRSKKIGTGLISDISSRLAQASCSLPQPWRLFRRVWRDRKSTRLNSSHLGISYAVFCLKKKKKHKHKEQIKHLSLQR